MSFRVLNIFTCSLAVILSSGVCSANSKNLEEASDRFYSELDYEALSLDIQEWFFPGDEKVEIVNLNVNPNENIFSESADNIANVFQSSHPMRERVLTNFDVKRSQSEEEPVTVECEGFISHRQKSLTLNNCLYFEDDESQLTMFQRINKPLEADGVWFSAVKMSDSYRDIPRRVLQFHKILVAAQAAPVETASIAGPKVQPEKKVRKSLSANSPRKYSKRNRKQGDDEMSEAEMCSRWGLCDGIQINKTGQGPIVIPY